MLHGREFGVPMCHKRLEFSGGEFFMSFWQRQKKSCTNAMLNRWRFVISLERIERKLSMFSLSAQLRSYFVGKSNCSCVLNCRACTLTHRRRMSWSPACIRSGRRGTNADIGRISHHSGFGIKTSTLSRAIFRRCPRPPLLPLLGNSNWHEEKEGGLRPF